MDNNIISSNNSSLQDIDTIIADLSKKLDPNKPITGSPELKTVDYFFDSISCRN